MHLQQSPKPYLVAIHGKLFSESNEQVTIQSLQAKVIQLETQLNNQRETADKGVKLMQVIYGSKFEQDFLF